MEKSIGMKGTMAELFSRDDVKKAVLENIQAAGKAAGLFSFEQVCSVEFAMGQTRNLMMDLQVKDIHLEADPFSVENGLLTPTLKSKRPQLKARYSKELAAMYSKIN